MISVYYVGQILPVKFTESYPNLSSEIQDLAANVFYNSLLKGFSENGVKVTCASSIPKEYIHLDYIFDESGIEFLPRAYRHNTLLRFLSNIFGTLKQILRWTNRNTGDKYVVFDILRVGQSIGGLLACKLKGIKTIAVVTDYPGHRMDSSFSITDKLAKVMLKKYDYYVVLSEYMREEMAVDAKRCIIIEGIYNQSNEKSKYNETSNSRFTILYAGSLHYKYGIMELVRAVQQINYPVCLRIFGNGEAAQEIENISKNDESICYCGVASHSNILAEERKADLLVNPRPTDEDYVKYSFPSKNMEYMASGTPTLLTKVGSLPSEYEKYAVVATNNSSSELKAKITDVIVSKNKGDDYYKNMGVKARKYILKNKNACTQAAKIIDLVVR